MKYKKKRLLTLLVSTLIFALLLSPQLALAATDPVPTPELAYFVFQSDSDRTLIVGDTNNTIHVILYDDNNDLFSGSVTAYISNADGNVTYYSISGSGGNYTISNVILDETGDYSLVISDRNGGYAGGTITVVNAVASATGSLIQNSKQTITVKLTDPDGNPLGRKPVTVDGTEVGVNTAQYNTAYDGTFSFAMTPTKMGNVNILYGGHAVLSLSVEPAYKSGGRIVSSTADNAGMSVEIARKGWAGANTVILTRDDLVADSMVAVPLSKKFDAPILMTPSGLLDSRVADEISALGARTVLMIGGIGAVSEDVEKSLTDRGLGVFRIAGLDRVETSVEVSSWVGSQRTVFLANAYAEPDALAASAFAAAMGIPILLTDGDVLSPAVRDRLTEMNTREVVILGGTGVISQNVEHTLRQSYSVKRLGGYDRYATEQLIFQEYFNTQSPQSSIYFTSAMVTASDVGGGKPIADALPAAALAAKTGGFMVALPPKNLPSPLGTFLLYHKGYISTSTMVGNSGAISTDLEQQLNTLLSH